MAQLESGPWGELRGKLGNYVVSKRNGKTVVHKKPKRSGEFTPAQLDQQIKFAMAADFYRPLRDLVMVTFRKTKKGNGYNNASGDFMSSAVSGQSPDIIINYEKVRISKGMLPPPHDPVASNDGTTINFTWEDNSMIGSADAGDDAVIVVHCPAKGQSFFLTNAASRSTGAATANARLFAGQEVHTWIAFLQADQRKSSDSIYTGAFTLPATKARASKNEKKKTATKARKTSSRKK